MDIEQNQRMLNWLEKEKIKDEFELKNNKQKLISDIKKLKKTDIFTTPKELSLWQKIRIMILGN
jgi:hypothetical protein